MKVFFIGLVSTITLYSCALPPGDQERAQRKLPDELTHQVSFVDEVKPILSSYCLPCHHGGTLLSHFNMETREKAFRLETKGPFILPGEPESSRLWQLVATEHPLRMHEDLMPSNSPRLSDSEKRTLYRWIEQGAPWPDGEKGRMRPIQEPYEA